MEVWIEFWSIEFNWKRSSGLSSNFFIQEKNIPMEQSKVDPNKKQARSSNYRDGERLFFIDRMQTLFQVQVKLQFIWQKCHLEIYIMNVSMKEKNGNVQIQRWAVQ